jgi:hypothetical protein
MSIPKKPLTGPQHPANAKPAPKPLASSPPARLRGGINVSKGGIGQTWLNLSKDWMNLKREGVDDSLRVQPQSQDKEVRRSPLGKLVAAIRWHFKNPFRS